MEREGCKVARKKSDQSGTEGSKTSPAETVVGLYKPTVRQCALLLLRLIELKEQEMGREVSRLRIAEVSLKRLWGRRRISPEFVEAVAEWMSDAGITLF